MRRAVASILVACAATHAAAQPAPPLDARHIGAFFDAAFDVQRQEHELVGAVVAVVRNGEVLVKRGYGFADLEARVPADPDQSLFRIASISKTFVWTAIMQLEEEGKLDLDDEVASHLDFEIPATHAEPIRIRHLLSHTAGFEQLATGSAVRAVADLQPLRDYLVASMPTRVRPPGEQAAYSNYGSALAGYLIERASGMSWSDYVDQRLLAPLAMHSTNAQPMMSDALMQRHAKGYRYRAGRFVPTAYAYIADGPAGLMSTTADDMTRWMIAHLGLGAWNGNRILEEATARRMREPLFAPHEGIAPILHGFFRGDRNGQIVFGHGGDTNQFHSQMSLFPEHGLGVFVAFNSDPGSNARSEIIAAFTDHFFPVELLPARSPQKEVRLADYAGEYLPLRRNESTFERLAMLVQTLEIGIDDSELVLTGGGTTRRFVATGPDRFTAVRGHQHLVFERNAGAGVEFALLGSALGSFERMTGLEAPGTVRMLLVSCALIAALAVLGYGWRAVRRAPAGQRLPTLHIAAAWTFAIVLVAALAQLAATLAGDVDEFEFGVPARAHVSLMACAINAVLGVLVVWFAGVQWVRRTGSAIARIRYSAVALAAAVNFWFAWSFNFLAYPFQ